MWKHVLTWNLRIRLSVQNLDTAFIKCTALFGSCSCSNTQGTVYGVLADVETVHDEAGKRRFGGYLI